MSLGDYVVSREPFPGVEKIIKEIQSKKNLSGQKKSEALSAALLKFITAAPTGEFLLIPILDFIDKVSQGKVVDHYTFSTFELWLNQFSSLSFEENFRVRGKIVGKSVPREAYQVFFPITAGKIYPGSHYVTAHSFPDIDTTVASFWGWVDAFGARVSHGLHLWNVPGGAPPAQVEVDLLFDQIFGSVVFSHLAKSRTSLTVSSIDLVTQSHVVRKTLQESTLGAEREKGHPATLLVDDEGAYLGEWRHMDVESVRFVITLLNQCLRWYENQLHVELIALFAKEPLTAQDLSRFVQKMVGMKMEECAPAREFSEAHQRQLADYLVKVLHVAKGLHTSIAEFAGAMQGLGLAELQHFIDLFSKLPKEKLELRPQIFSSLAKIIQALDQAIYAIRLYVEKFDVALKVKSAVLGLAPQHINARADLEEIRGKIDDFPYLTVTTTDSDGKLYPLGVIHATDLYRTPLGTVSLRDFCNREETKIPPYLEVISVIDHHKSSLTTTVPPVAHITDAQSSNALVAQIAFSINDQYSTGGMTLKEIETQIREVQTRLQTSAGKRILQRLLQRHLAFEQKGSFFVAAKREIVEYLHFLYAILDDTDLLTKISTRDVECVASLLNRLNSLIAKQEVEVVHFDDLPRDEKFAKMAAKRLLQNKELYSLYSKTYASKERAIEENLKRAAHGETSTMFADTKEQNGCCQVGQTKLFAKNFPVFEKHRVALRRLWQEAATEVHKKKKEIDFYLHMVSTLAGAEELYAGSEGVYSHQDEIWIWIPKAEEAVAHLKTFLNAFQASPQVAGQPMEVEFLGDNAQELEQIFVESFRDISKKRSSQGIPMAVLRFHAGSINSRKAMISPYLPTL
jgi:hypothetical protein